MNKFNLLLLLIIIIISGCSKDEKDVSLIKETSQELEMISSYNEAHQALKEGDPFFAAKKFLEAELLYPQSSWAPKAALMASYSYYMQNYYTEATLNLERYIKTYPNDKNLPYAHYLIGMCYYESIEDEKRDSGPLIKAKEKFNFIIKNYPNTEFAIDANFKLNLIQDVLASKEMYLGRHYIKKGKWIAAINRFKVVTEDYDKTVFIEEALHRLVEVNYKLGLIDESQKYAKILGYNYLSSEWYKKSYKVFNKNYKAQINKAIKKDKKDKKGVLNKFKKLFD
jgi:outer membrane protein assembly factor BamD